MKNLLIKFLIIFSPLIQAKELLKMDHAYFILELGNSEGVFNANSKDELNIFKKPNLKEAIIDTYDIKKMRDEQIPTRHIFKLFFKELTNASFNGIAATEKKGDFYKVTYNGQSAWIHKKDIYQVNIILKELDDVFAISKKEKLYSKPSFTSKQIQVSQLERHSSRNYDVSYLDHKIIDRKLWIKIRIGKNREVCGGGGVFEFKLKKPVEVWIHPFTSNGDRRYFPFISC